MTRHRKHSLVGWVQMSWESYCTMWTTRSSSWIGVEAFKSRAVCAVGTVLLIMSHRSWSTRLIPEQSDLYSLRSTCKVSHTGYPQSEWPC